MPALDRVGRERERLNALHDAIAIIVAEIGQKDLALRDAIVRQFRAAERKMTAEYPPDEAGDAASVAGRVCRALRLYSALWARASACEIRPGTFRGRLLGCFQFMVAPSFRSQAMQPPPPPRRPPPEARDGRSPKRMEEKHSS